MSLRIFLPLPMCPFQTGLKYIPCPPSVCTCVYSGLATMAFTTCPRCAPVWCTCHAPAPRAVRRSNHIPQPLWSGGAYCSLTNKCPTQCLFPHHHTHHTPPQPADQRTSHPTMHARTALVMAMAALALSPMVAAARDPFSIGSSEYGYPVYNVDGQNITVKFYSWGTGMGSCT